MSISEYSRRKFLKDAMIVSAGAAIAPHILKGFPQQKVNIAYIGIGNRGWDVIRGLEATGLTNVVALCDVDMEAPHTQNALKKFPSVPRFQDFRQLFDKMGSQIDAVTVAVPDFAHFPITMM